MRYKDISNISNIVHDHLKNNDDGQVIAQTLKNLDTLRDILILDQEEDEETEEDDEV